MSKIYHVDLNELKKKIEKIDSELILIIADKKVYELYELGTIFHSFKNKKVICCPVNGEEKSKTLAVYKKVTDYFIDQGVHRHAHLLSIGGGSVSDLAGFVAATLLRGISWSVIPTTLLSMVDAGIGGKTGLNTDQGKNLIGAFHLPQSVYICGKFLKALPLEEHLSGKGEVLKYAYLSEKIFQSVLNEQALEKVILQCAEYKQKLVDKDFKEKNERKLLNFGHSFGHAYEKLYQIPHGEAIVWGLLTILLMEKFSLDHFRFLTKSLGLSELKKPWKKINQTEVFQYLVKDKKLINDKEIELVVPHKIGKVKIEKRSLEKLKERFKEVKVELEKFTF
jgi:3-dehydroquinate synthase